MSRAESRARKDAIFHAMDATRRTEAATAIQFQRNGRAVVSLAVALSGLTPAEAVMAATAGGAAALRLTDRGVLRVGARCDLAILESRHWLDIAYHLGSGGVATTVRRGQVISG